MRAFFRGMINIWCSWSVAFPGRGSISAGARNVVFFDTNALWNGTGMVSKAAGARSTILSSNYCPIIVVCLAEAILGFPAQILNSEFRAAAVFGDVGG